MSRYMGVPHELADGSLLVILEGSATFEHRGRRIGDRLALEVWQRVESMDLSPESVATLHRLVEERLPRTTTRRRAGTRTKGNER